MKKFLCLIFLGLMTVVTAVGAQQYRFQPRYQLPPQQYIQQNAGATQMYSWGHQPQVYYQATQQWYPPQQPTYRLPPQQYIQQNAGATQMYSWGHQPPVYQWRH
jgi:hypothetical protein